MTDNWTGKELVMKKGYNETLLRVNLSNGKTSKEKISDSTKRDFLGGGDSR